MHIPDQMLHGDIMPKTAEFLIETADRCTVSRAKAASYWSAWKPCVTD
jgi:hypothetical protein